MGIVIASILWGFAEATLFFIIPDVLLSAVALRSGKKAFYACCYALLGALIGGTIMYFWGVTNPASSYQIVEKVPAIDQAMMQEVKTSLASDGLLSMILGPAKGIPYKIYAITASGVGISYAAFLLSSIPARFGRFFLVTLLAWAIGKYALPKWSLKSKFIIWAVAWLIIYTLYFWNNPS
jgi:membrane protein YqaA with SNARE-associated domain